MKNILGLDIGSNSIGWALIGNDLEEHTGKIIAAGSRIIPMEGREKDFEAGNSVSKNADRRVTRSARRLLQRYRLRRTRLIKVLKTLNWISNNFPEDFKHLDKFNINDYLPFSTETIEDAKKLFNSQSIPNDWIIYFLRNKALKEKITLQELARIIYHFNQRRGFKSSRKDRKEELTETEEIKFPLREKSVEVLTINSIQETGEKNKFGKVFLVHAATPELNQIVGTITRKMIPDWISKKIELEITKITNKAGEIRYEFRLPDRSDWEKMKVALERDIKESGLHISQYHLNQLLVNRNYRIKDRIVDRSLYQAEFDAIWAKQSEYHKELNDNSILPSLVELLYKHNYEKRNELLKNDLHYLLKNDIIYYQRDLKSQKHLIADCRYEKKMDNNGNIYGVKVAHKSSPVFQEFRIWQDIQSLKIFRLEQIESNGKIKFDVDETKIYLTQDKVERLFTLFDKKNNLTQKEIFKELSDEKHKLSETTHRLNYPKEKIFKGNETKSFFRKVFKKHNYEIQGEQILNDKSKFELLWHIFYSLPDEKSIVSALTRNFSFPNDLARHIAKLPEFKSEFASYSSKAIKKLLSLMRTGSYWKMEDISQQIKERIEKIITGEYDENISIEVRNKIVDWQIHNKKLNSIECFNGLPLWLAAYVVYGRHSERENSDKFESFDEIKLINQNTLRNPIVEQITNETLQVVKEIWKNYGRPEEIHIELARDLKRNAEERKKINDQIFKNQTDRKRVVAILKELKNANSDSPSDIERLRLWEETGNREAKDSFPKFSKEPTKQEIEKYLLWGEQNHISPYTGNIIPLSKLFTPEYEIEHIIPKSRFFDDSFGNKTISEASVNSFKDNNTAMQMINEHGGREIEHRGKRFKLLSVDEYKQHIKSTFYGKWKKVNYFLREDIPEDFITRQINDTRYISRKLGELLYPVADDEVVFTIGSITSELKDKWGLNRVWKEILRPRFERLEKITGEKLIDLDKEHNDIHFKKDYKRVDHRHHALDALIIAATSREHIRYLNSLNAASEKDKLNRKYKLVKSKIREFNLPWDTFTKDVKDTLKQIIVSHKNRTRVVTKGFNLYTKWVLDNGTWIKKMVRQDNNSLFSVRKSLFKEPLGKINLAEYKDVNVKKAVEVQFNYLTKYTSKLQPRISNKYLRNYINKLIKNCEFDLSATLKYIKDNPIKDNDGKVLPKIQILEFSEYAAKRVTLDKTFDIKKIEKIPYSSHNNNRLVKILREHLNENGNNPAEAFSGEGLDVLAKKYGKPITKVTTFEEIGSKFSLGGKLVEADKGSNVFFVIYENTNDRNDRIITSESSLPLLNVIECISNNLPIVQDKPGYKTIILSPNDLVYVPEVDENINSIDWTIKQNISDRIYKVVSFSKTQCFFIPHFVSSPLIETTELGHNNKSEKTWDGIMIKNVCIKINIDRLGNIKLAI